MFACLPTLAAGAIHSSGSQLLLFALGKALVYTFYKKCCNFLAILHPSLDCGLEKYTSSVAESHHFYAAKAPIKKFACVSGSCPNL
jgi:hypothetical protein